MREEFDLQPGSFVNQSQADAVCGNDPAFNSNLERADIETPSQVGESRRNPDTGIPGFALYEETGWLRRIHNKAPAGSSCNRRQCQIRSTSRAE